MIIMTYVPILWQWFRIEHWLSDPVDALEREKSGKALRTLIITQILIAIGFILDAILLALHFRHGFLPTNHEGPKNFSNYTFVYI